MLPVPQNYSIWPSVIQTDIPSEMTITPNEKAFLFKEGEEYRLTIIPVNSDEVYYYTPSTCQKLAVLGHNGILRFSFTFEDEQEYNIILEYGEAKLQIFTVFAVKEDLYPLQPLKGDLHGHSYRSDGKRDPAALAGHYREQGYDFFALTDHNRYFPGGEIDETFDGVEMGLNRVKGEEVHVPGTVIHIVHVGGNSSVADLYVHNGEACEQEYAEYESRVPEHVPQKYRTRYAKVMWATDKIHAAGGLAIFPHPFWRPGNSKVYNVCTDFARLLLKSGMFDAYELIGGMGQLGNNLSVALWADLRAEGLSIPVVGSSDVHALQGSPTFPHLFTVCFAKENSNDGVLQAVREQNSVAVEATGDEYARHYRCYGSLRLVTYAQFLLRHFFPRMQRLCQGEGVAMRSYAIGEAESALIELQAAQAEAFRKRFFGQLPPVLPSAAVLDFEARWRDVQLHGPQTKGGTIETPPVTLQI